MRGRGQEESWFGYRFRGFLEFTQDGGEHLEPEDSVLFGLSAYLIGAAAIKLQEMEVKNRLLES